MALQFKSTTGTSKVSPTRSGGVQFKSNVPKTYQKQQEIQPTQPTEESRLDEFGLPKATLSADRGGTRISEQQMKSEEYKQQPLLKKVVGLFSVKDLISGISSLVKKKADSKKPEAVQLMDQHFNAMADYYTEQLSQPGGATGKSAQEIEKIIKDDLGSLDKGVVGIVAHTFLPTRVITENPQAKLKNAVVQQSLDDYAQKNPIPAIIGETVGGIANLILFKEMGAGFGLSGKVSEAAGGLKNLYPTLTRIAGYAAEGGSIFGIERAVNEAFNQIQSGKLDTLKIATEGMKGAGTGALISTSGALPTLGARVAAGGTIFAGLTTAAKLIQDGKLNSKDLVDIAVSGLVGSLFELTGGTKRSGILRGQELEQLNKDIIISRIMGNNPKLTRAEAEKMAILMEDLPRAAISQLNEKQKSKIQEELNTISEQLKGKTKQQQTEIMNEVIDNIKSGNSIITPSIKFTDNILKNYENAKAKVETEKGQSDPVAIKELLDAQVQLKNYQEAKQENVFAVSTGDGQTRYAEINIVKMNDNKWAYSYNINTDANSMVSDFLVNEFTNSSEEAIKKAKQDIINWSESQLKSAQGTTRDQLDIILNAVRNVDPKLDVPVEVREPRIEIEKTQREQILDEYRNTTLPEYNTDKEIVNLDAFVDKIRELDPKNETDKILMRDGSKYEVTVSYPHSLGEMGNQTEFIYKEKPTIAELRSDLLDTYKEFKKDVNKPMAVGIVAKSARDENIEKAIDNVLKPKTQKEKVAEAVKEKPKTIKEVSDETKILEPNVRRILGMGAKEGTFERVDKGVYILKKGDKQIAYIHTGDAIEVLPKLAKDGLKADMVFLDIPYKTPAVVGGNRGIKYDYITPEQFKVVVDAVKEIVRNDDSPVFYMYSQARSGEKEMQKYTDIISKEFKPVARGEYTKLQLDGVTRVRNMRGDVIEPEGILLLTKDGVTNLVNPNLNFKLIRPRGYQTEKPAEMIKKLIEMSTEEGEVILDPFAGSGVVPAEAVKAGRKAVAIEKSEKAVEENIKPRIEEAAKKIDEFTGKEIQQVAIVDIIPEERGKVKQETIDQVLADKEIKRPVLLRKQGDKYLIVDGANRVEAAKQLGFTEVPAVLETIDTEPKPRFAKKEPIAKLPQTSRKAEQLDEKQSVEVATKVMPKKPAIPVLGTFLVKDGVMSATDLEIGLKLKTGLKDGIYTVVGKEAVPAKDISADDFPIVPEAKGEPMFKLISDNFRKVIKRSIDFIDKKNMRNEITGTYVISDGRNIIIRATDAYTLFKKTLPAKVSEAGKFIFIPQKMEKVINYVGALTEATLDKDKQFVKFAGDNGEVVVRTIEGDFPDTSNVYPAFTKQYLFERKDLLNAIKELKPFYNKQLVDKKSVEVVYDTKNRKLNITTTNEIEGKRKTISVSATEKDVDIPEGLENDGAVVMPLMPEGNKLWLDPNYIERALGVLDEDATFMYLTKDPKRPALFTEKSENEMIPAGYKRGKDIKIKKGTKLFHGTDKNSAVSIIQDGLNKTGDETATYGRAIYLTPDYTTAQDYANETNNGQVITITPDRDLKLYQPTTSEREDLIDKIGDDQDEFIKQMLGEEYDGFYIPDDGRGDGGEQVVLYNDNDSFLYNAKEADEVRKEHNKTAVSTKPKGKRAPSGIASAGGNNIGSFEDLSGIEEKTESQLKLYEEVKNLIKKYAKTIGENYLPRNALGVYYPNTTNIRIKGMNDVSVAAHEITHFLDFAYKISDLLMGIKGMSITGRPIYDSSTYKLRKEMTQLYEQYYPGGKSTHKLRKRMLEGFATLLQKYIEQPTMITAQYPNLVREFLTREGKFYKPVIGEILKDLRDIVSRYQGLSALDKIGSRIINEKVNVNKNSFLKFWDRVKTEIADNIYPIEKLAKRAGVHFTKQDPSLWLRQYNSSNALIMNNINGNRGYWGWRNGELVKLHDFNWKDLIKDIKKSKTADQFGTYLVARREYFMYQELKQMSEDNPDRIKLQQILNNDGFTEQEIEEAYLQNKDRFKELEEKFDILTKEDLNFLHDTQVQLLNNEDYNRLINQEGYASFKRYFYDEIVGEEEMPIGRVRFGTTKVSSLLHRTGSKKPIINPLASALRNHAEIMRKGMKQTIYNRIGAISEKLPDLFQRLQLKGIPDREGKIIYPQEKDPNIIMARSGYKRVPILTDNVIKRTIDEVLTHQNISIFEKFLMGASRFFTKGTTGLFPGFSLTNYTVDQLTGTAQTRNKYIPLYDPLRELFTALNNKSSLENKYFQEYMVMGGERQTMVGWQDMSPNELFDTIARERAGLLKVVDALNKGIDVFALPSKWSEIATRATEYIKSREAGKSQIVALEEAGRVTAPFHHVGRLGGGRFGKTYIKSIPFFNPAIQVLAQAIETLETPEGRQRYAFVSLAVIAASISGLMLILSKGTDEQKDLFSDISPDELNKYIWLPDPDGKDLIKIRVPDQMNFIATLINMAIADKKLNADYTAGEYINAGMSWLPQQLDISQPTKALLAWIPQLIKPGVLTIAGVKDFPRIMPLESQMQQSKSPGLRATESTSPVAKWLGKTFNLSPIKIDYLLTGYAGRATGFLTGKPGIYNPFKSMQRKYYFSSGRKVQQFYDLKERNDQDYYDYKHKLKSFGLGERTQIIQLRSKLNSISDLIGQYRDIDTDKQPEKAEKLRNKILEKINAL